MSTSVSNGTTATSSAAGSGFFNLVVNGTPIAFILALSRSDSSCSSNLSFLVEPNLAVQEHFTTLVGVNAKIVCPDFEDFAPKIL
jgi:hypothetical protein